MGVEKQQPYYLWNEFHQVNAVPWVMLTWDEALTWKCREEMCSFLREHMHNVCVRAC